ncbi:glycosyltransferase family protein [Janthinobacterium svalbardensis]|uniref:CgeB family protein n=1 Tax=Janthinobacterium svalbardensis TaxID=368607 RepID=UPI002FCD7578
MKILLVCMRYDYGDPSRGESYEYYNFYQSLISLGHEVLLFDYMTVLKEIGKPEMNRKLLETAESFSPDLAMFSLYTDQFEPASIESLRRYTKTLCFFHDDTWRVDYSKYWASFFDNFTTPDIYGVERYRKQGIMHAVHFPFGANELLYEKREKEKIYDISFVGGWHPYRAWLVKRLRNAGMRVVTAGHRWERGIVAHSEMVDIFNQSKINLNLSNSASWDLRYLATSPYGIVNRIRSKKNLEQLKARHFEINSTGAFQLSYYVEGLEKYYEIGSEIGIYIDADDLIEKAKFYLKEDTRREEIAAAGYKRTLEEHVFSARFNHVFKEIGLLS